MHDFLSCCLVLAVISVVLIIVNKSILAAGSDEQGKQSLFRVTATPESRAYLELWKQHAAQPVPDDLLILTKLETWYEDQRIMRTSQILVDFGSGGRSSVPMT
jgi:hypothetical protein